MTPALSLLAAFTVLTVGFTNEKEPENIYGFKVKNIDGKEVKLSKYKGKALLIVNVASKCGNTPQYAGLEDLYKRYKKRGFEILAFPCNDFRSQEPGTEKEIKDFCSSTYHVTFPLFAKIHVKGDEQAPLYKWLLAQAPRHEDVEWNFAKFLVSRKGKVIGRFEPKTQPDDKAMVKAIDEALAAESKEVSPPSRY